MLKSKPLASKLFYYQILLMIIGFIYISPILLASGFNNLAMLRLQQPWMTAMIDLSVPVCQEHGDFPEIAKYLDRATALNPSSETILINQARLSWLSGHCQQAESLWKKAMQNNPGNEIAAVSIFWMDKETLSSSTLLPQLTLYAQLRGAYTQELKEDRSAISWYDLILTLQPSRKVVDTLISLYQKINETYDPVTLWQRLNNSLPPDNADHWWAIGQIAELQQDWQAASYAYKTGVNLTTDTYDFRMQQGYVFGKLGDQEQAKQAYQQARMTEPNMADPYINLGALALQAKSYQEAFTWFDQAREVAPMSNWAPFYLGYTYYLMVDDQQAQIYLSDVVQKEVDTYLAYQSATILALSLHRTGKIEEAIHLLTWVISSKLGQSGDRAILLGDWQLELGNCDKALQAYRQGELWGSSQATQKINEIGTCETHP